MVVKKPKTPTLPKGKAEGARVGRNWVVDRRPLTSSERAQGRKLGRKYLLAATP